MNPRLTRLAMLLVMCVLPCLFPPLRLVAQAAPATVLDKQGLVIVTIGNLITNASPSMPLPLGAEVRVVGKGQVRLQFTPNCVRVLGDDQALSITSGTCPATGTPASTPSSEPAR